MEGSVLMSTKAQINAVNKYNREKTKVVLVRLNKQTDTDIIEHLETVTSKMGYIKKLIREDIGCGRM